MKICALVTAWRRPEIVKVFLDRFEKVKPDYAEVSMIPVLSPEDPSFKTLKHFFKDYDYLVFKNLPLGEKRNAGLKYALQKDWDFLLDMGSDNFFTPLFWDLYRDKFHLDFFGLQNLYIYDIYHNKAIFLRNYSTIGGEPISYGAGRMYSREVCEKVPVMWRPDVNSGLDGFSYFNITRAGFKHTLINNGEMPIMLDLKTNTNLHHFTHLEHRRDKYIEPSKIRELFGLNELDLHPKCLELIEIEGFHREICKKAQEIGYEKAFNCVNQIYATNFGETRYKNYQSYRSVIYQRGKK